MKDNTTLPLIEEAYRLSEQRLQSQFSAALAADQRAMTAAGMLIAAAAILTALADNASASWAMIVGAAGLALAALLAWFSARPQDFYAPGALFEDLAEDIACRASLAVVRSDLGKFNDKHARQNARAMDRSANMMSFAFVIALASVFFVASVEGFAIYRAEEQIEQPSGE